MIRQRADSDRDDERAHRRQQAVDRSRVSPRRREGIVPIQRAIGNQAVQRLSDGGHTPPGLAVSQPGDPAEREAERVAGEVTGTGPSGSSNRSRPIQTESDRVQRLCGRCQRRYRAGEPLDCDECEASLQRETERERDGTSPTTPTPSPSPEAALATATKETPASPERQIRRARTGGRPLPDSQRSFFESRFGRDFSAVRLHTGSAADRAARSVGARAFTVGTDVVFRSGAYSESGGPDDRLVAHELTHVVQQTDPRRLDHAARDRGDAPAGTALDSSQDRAARTEAALNGERAGDTTVDRPTIRTHGRAGTVQRDSGSGSGSGSKQSDPLCTDYVYVIHRAVIRTRLSEWQADQTTENRLALVKELKWIHRCGSDSERTEIKGILRTELQPDQADALWEEAGEPFGGYRGSYPGYYGGGKRHLEGLGTSETDPYESFRYDPRSGDTARFESGAKSAAKSEESVLQTTDLLYFYGHHYAQYNNPGVFANGVQTQFIDLRFLRKHGAFNRVKLVVSTSCATICKEAIEVFAPLFPNAVILGYRKSAPLEGSKVRRDFESKIQGIQKTLFLEESVDVNAIIDAWKSVIESHHPDESRRLPGYYRNGTVHYLENGDWKSMNATDAANTCKKKGSQIEEASD